MAAQPGHKKAGGRKKGTPNKLNKTVKEMILSALDKAGGAEYLLTQARDNPAAFMTLVGKVLPTQITGDPDSPLQIQKIERVIIESTDTDS